MDLYIELVNILLNFIHFVRIGNWEGYLEVMFEFLPFCFWLNRHNYARNLSFYYARMIVLPFTNAQAHEYLKNGGFSGSLTRAPHTNIPYHQIIETAINRQWKYGGIGGNTENLEATECWTRNSHLIAALREGMNKKTRKKTKQKHVNLGKPRMQRDEKDVSNLKDCIKTWLPSLWHPEQEITNISSGYKATKEMRDEIVGKLKKSGEAQYDEFFKWITTAEAEKSYYEPIKRNEFKLFKEKTLKKKSSIPEDESQSFEDILLKYDNEELDLRNILNYCVTTRRWALVNQDNKSCQSQISLFRNHLQGMCPMPKVTTPPDPIKATIVGAMRFVRGTPITGLPKRGTFRMWATRLMNRFKSLPGNELHIIFDNYGYNHQHPGKNRDQDDSERWINNLDQELPFPSEWEGFFKNGTNKLQLVNLLVDLIKDSAVGKDVFVNRGNDCYFRQNN